LEEFENENRLLELKYDKILQGVYEKRKQNIGQKELYGEFWMRVISNHKILKDFIGEEDKPLLKHLIDVRYVKLDDGNV
jgi:hypothetical protein